MKTSLGRVEVPEPVDRILVAQAVADDLTLVSGDRILRRYPVPVEW
ncbi:MAG: hypothetical protein ACRDHS_08805 [Actinomycetota bacterium]